MPTTATHRSVAIALTASTLTVLACACSSTTTPDAATTSTRTAAVSASPSPPSSAAEALAAYRAMWADVVTANQTSNYQAPYLSDYLGGQALTTLSANMAAEKAHGVIALGQPVLHPVVVTASAISVDIQDCVQDTGWLEYYAATRKPVNAIPGGYRSTTATVTDQSGVWKVTEMNSGSDGSCHVSP